MEIVVTPNNQWYTVGDNGAEFVNIPRGSIVFNHKQTEELLKNGKATSDGGRARALVNGTAFLGGTAHRGEGEWITPEVPSFSVGWDYNSSSSSDNSSSSSDSSSKKSQEIFDWIEIAIKRIEREIDNLDKKANNIYESWTSRNRALASEIDKVGNEIVLQQKAYDGYMYAANQVGLSSEWKKKVQSGAIDIDNITDDVLKEKIKDYQKYYEQALACKDAIEELKEKEAELYAQRLKNVSDKYDGILGVIEHEKNILEQYISKSEAQGHLVSGEYYKALASNEKDNLAQLKKEKNAMLAELQSAMESGTITNGSEAWHDMIASIDEVTLAIAESETQLIEYQQTLQQLSWETFDLLQEKISAVSEEADFLIELMSNDKLYDNSGKLTDEGKATMGLHGQNYNSYMYQADLVAEEIERLKKQLEEDPYDTELEARYREMIALQQEYILNAEQEKDAIHDLVEEGIQVELDSLSELIDKYTEALDSQKDLYEYQKKVLDINNKISNLEKMQSAYSGDDSEEAQQKLQQISVDLESARQELQEAEHEKLISDTEALLQNLYDEYELILNERLDNLDYLVEQMIEEVNVSATNISETISSKAEEVGYSLSESMSSVWDKNSVSTNNVITTYGEKFTLAQTTTNNSLGVINTNLQNMITQLNKLAKTDVKSTSVSSAANSSEANGKKSDSKEEKKDSNSNKSKITDETLMGVASVIWIYGGESSGWGSNPERKKKLSDKLGSSNASKVQDYINSYGSSGKLYDFWIKKNKNLSAYKYGAFKTGAKAIDKNQMAWTQENGMEFIVRPSDGAILTPIAKSDSVLTSAASNNIWNMANSPAEFIRDNLGIGSANVPSAQNINNTYSQHIDKVILDFKNVKNYDEMLTQMQHDKSFEKLIMAMTIDRIAGRSSLAKGKSIR